MSGAGGEARVPMKSRAKIASVLYVILALVCIGVLVLEFNRSAKARRTSSVASGGGAAA